jgi:hypothetical protein
MSLKATFVPCVFIMTNEALLSDGHVIRLLMFLLPQYYEYKVSPR